MAAYVNFAIWQPSCNNAYRGRNPGQHHRPLPAASFRRDVTTLLVITDHSVAGWILPAQVPGAGHAGYLPTRRQTFVCFVSSPSAFLPWITTVS